MRYARSFQFDVEHIFLLCNIQRKHHGCVCLISIHESTELSSLMSSNHNHPVFMET